MAEEAEGQETGAAGIDPVAMGMVINRAPSGVDGGGLLHWALLQRKRLRIASRLCRLGVCARVIVAVLVTPLSVMSAQAAPSVNLSGTWKDLHGNKIVISQNGAKVSLTAPNGRVLSGNLNGNVLTLEADFSGSEVKGAPPEVQSAVNARHLKISFTGTVESDGHKIVGTETRPDDVRWNGDHLITAIATGAGSPVTLIVGAIEGWALGMEPNDRP
jgi:hypothetical protein